jgi:2',3'-cyclic-nucleotide 2'-phosphodiesterase (5'-nucleotidase family)
MSEPDRFRLTRSRFIGVLAVCLLVAAGCVAVSRAPRAAGTGDRTAVILAINDVYRIQGLEGGRVGGLARLRSLRRELEREHPDLLLLHGGDLLFPSFLSRSFFGEQMIDVLNLMDGDGAAFDRRMFAVFGNHEFDRDAREQAGILDSRVEESQFAWLGSNIVFRRDAAGPLVAASNLVDSALVESGGIKIGLLGLTVPIRAPGYVERFRDPISTARTFTADLRARGAEVVIALTHLPWSLDKQLLSELGSAGPDLVIGGHDHERMDLDVEGRRVLKADADARTATVAWMTRRAGGDIQVRSESIPLIEASWTRDAAVSVRVDAWLERHERMFCESAGSPPRCLGEVLGHTRTPLQAEESKIRSVETSLGDWVTDQMVATFAQCGAQAAFINAGALRLNHDLPADYAITRRHVEELFAFPAPLRLLKIDGRVLQQVVERAVQNWPGSGNWLQVSGMAFVHDQTRGTASGLTLVSSRGARRVAPDDQILVVATDFLIDRNGNQDGYTMLGPEQVVDCPPRSVDLKTIVVDALRAAGPRGIAPESHGRICAAPPATDCLAVTTRP